MTDHEKLAELLGADGYGTHKCSCCGGLGYMYSDAQQEAVMCRVCRGERIVKEPRPIPELIEIAEKRLMTAGKWLTLEAMFGPDQTPTYVASCNDIDNNVGGVAASCGSEQEARLKCAIKVLERLKGEGQRGQCVRCKLPRLVSAEEEAEL